jgi:C1A family cysteine protease
VSVLPIGLAFVLLVLVGLPALASATAPQAAPVNPAFLRYEKNVAGLAPMRTVEGGYTLGLVPPPMLLPDSPSAASPADILTAPATFDLRASGKVSPVKNQGQFGTCWTFATLGSLESSFLPGTLYDFSEDNVARTAGFDYDAYNGGGNSDMSTADLAKSGPVFETDDAYGDSTTPAGLTPRAHLQDSLILVNDGASTKDQAGDIAAIKDWLTTGSAAYTTMRWSSAAYNATGKCYYGGASSYTGEGGHAVTIVGWDDTFSASNFTSHPVGDGAWLIKNSWGSSWGQSGYFYLSYYDYWAERFAVAFEGMSASTYAGIYQYDPLGWVGSWSYAWGANDFTATSSDPITMVGFYTPVADSQYEVFTASTHGGARTAQGTGTLSRAGYHTVALATPLAVTNGQSFSIILKLTTPGYSWPMAAEYAYSGYSSGATSAAGQSFMSSDGSNWTDVGSPSSGTPRNVCIKAFSKPASADTTAPATTASGVPAGWSKIAVTVSFSADDGAGVGVQATLARVDGGAYQQCSSILVSADGTHTVQYYSVDKVGNAETPKSATVKVDSTKPSTAATNLQASATTGWQSATSMGVVLTPSDATSGVARLDYTIDATPYANVGATAATAAISGAGSHAVTYRATDVAGNLETTKTGYVNLDPTAPSAGAQISAPAAPNAAGWYTNGPVTLVISGSDALSGVATKEYRVKGATSWTTYTGPVACPQGATTFEYRVIDGAANVSTTGTIAASVDTQAPTTTTPLGASTSWTNAAPMITLLVNDGASGPAVTQYRRQGAATWTTYTAPFQVTTQGASTWEYRSVDVAGNTESPKTFSLQLDSQAPATAAFAASAKLRKSVVLKYQVNDATPGCGSATAVIRIYKGKRLKKTLKPVVCRTGAKSSYKWKCTLPAGRYTIRVSATDAAGNVQSKVGSARLKIR